MAHLCGIAAHECDGYGEDIAERPLLDDGNELYWRGHIGDKGFRSNWSHRRRQLGVGRAEGKSRDDTRRLLGVWRGERLRTRYCTHARSCSSPDSSVLGVFRRRHLLGANEDQPDSSERDLGDSQRYSSGLGPVQLEYLRDPFRSLAWPVPLARRFGRSLASPFP